MTITSAAKSCFFLVLTVLLIVAVVVCVFIFYPQYLNYLGGAGMLLVVGFIFYVNIPPFVYFIAERASDVMAIYQDKSGEGLHIFSDFTTSRIKSGLCPLRTIQYYFLITETHKLFYKELFTHEMESAKGHYGYEDFSSFEEDVLGGEDYKKALEKFSTKAGWQLELGEESRKGEDESFVTKMGGYTYKIVTETGMVQDTLKICCYDGDDFEKILWSKKI